MVRNVTSKTKGKNIRGQHIDKTVNKRSYSRNDLKMARLQSEMGADPITQRERMRQSGKTKRAAAYSTAVAASSASIADSNQQVYNQMAGGGLGYENPEQSESSSTPNGKLPSDVIIGR